MSSRTSSFSLLVAFLALASHACRDATRSLVPTAMSVAAAEEAPLVPRIIPPEATDAAIDWIPASRPELNQHHVWLDPSVPRRPKLVVFLPGNPGKPNGSRLLLSEAARLGYYVVGLTYANEFAVISPCVSSPDPDCPANIRLEILDGVDRSSSLSVNRANSIDNRLTKLLLYLEAHFPDEGWMRFISDGEPDWPEIIVAGHSFGAAQAALIGTVRKVNRVVMISGPAPEERAAWVSIGSTPAAKYFALYHQHETWTAVISADVVALDLDRFGNPIAPELSEPPFGGTHLLATDLAPRGPNDPATAHLSTAIDVRTPLAPDGTPLLRNAWRYLFGDHTDEDHE